MKGCWDIRLARRRKNMATKEVKHNREQCSIIAITEATIAVAILEHRRRKLSSGQLQNCDLQFSNLTHVRPKLLFTLVFSYKRRRASHKTAARNYLEKLERKRRGRSEFKGADAASLKNLAELFGFTLCRSQLILFFTLWLK